MFDEEGLPAVFARHARHAEATRRAVRGWGLDIVCRNPDDYSRTLTAVMVPDGHDADRVRQLICEHYNMSLGAGLGRWLAGCSASAISGISATSRWPAPCAGCRWGWPARACPSPVTASARPSDYLESAG